ncbi:heavy-metal-associated domain-containing protein [Rothia amarae]|uniref:Heavy-metal-associated domain-containing protein n=1 Tax=Rothia amarae TaxID=169480 RepID=A0A7H2BK57_9MICC|nr:heavy-metal-associated domain-containing protein [Rothia amarae]QNV40053.1 heavy-metal-associated domain-containing protein [Rothia amarae]
MSATVVHATGLTCQHCAASVTEEVQEIENVNEVNVEVVKDGQSTITIDHDGELDDAKVEAAIAEAGYELVK